MISVSICEERVEEEVKALKEGKDRLKQARRHITKSGVNSVVELRLESICKAW